MGGLVNGFRALVLVTIIALALIVSMTVITLTDHPYPTSYDEALIFLVGGVVGAGAVKAGNGLAK